VVAALFVEADGPYSEIDVDLWDLVRDARKYQGPHPVVAHPPCERWGRYWSGGPSAKIRRLAGDDGDCFAAAIRAVRHYGGVLEHPEGSKAWEWWGIEKPPRHGGWIPADRWGYTCCVEQGHYGHAARKATWLYAVGTSLPSLQWGPCRDKIRLDAGFHSTQERKDKIAAGWKPLKRLSRKERLLTPTAFRDVLVTMARGVL
jgi:hypothetical protein